LFIIQGQGNSTTVLLPLTLNTHIKAGYWLVRTGFNLTLTVRCHAFHGYYHVL